MKIRFIIPALVTATVSLFGDQFSLVKPYEVNEKTLEADVIVVGGGAAGCIVMNRLSENGRFSVLGIEAGANLTGYPPLYIAL